MADRPVSRKKNITGSGSVNRRGSGLSGGTSGNRAGGFGGGSGSSGGGLGKLLIIAIIVLLGGGGGLGAFLGGGSDGGTGSISSNTTTSTINTIGSMASLLLGSGYTSTAESGNASWSSKANTGILDDTVASTAREKYTKLLGDGKDTVTILVYACGTDLESRGAMATKDMQEMLNATVSDNINLLVYTGGCTNWQNNVVSSKTNQIYQIHGGKLDLVKDNLGDLPMTDPATLSSFIKWGGKNYPADRYALIFWDHGGGSVTGYGYDEKHKTSGSMDLSKINKALTDGGLKYDFVSACSSQCPGQKTTLSVVDLAELSATVPEDLKSFASSTSELIDKKEYQTVSTARSSTREFATSSKIDQIDLIDFAIKLGNDEGKELSDTLKSAVKYNKTSSNMTNAYGLSIYFPYRTTGKVDSAVSTYDQIGMDDSYSECIQKFASMAYYGQAAGSATSNSSPASMLFGSGSEGSMDSAQAVMELINVFMSASGSGRDATAFLDNGVDADAAAEYIAENNIGAEDLKWQTNATGDKVIALSDEQWEQVEGIELTTFVDDGEGYIDLGLDNTFDWDEEGNLICPTDRSWLAIDGQIVAYYHIDTTGDSSNYTITGRVPVLLNGERADLILVFDSANEDGYIAGATYDYKDGETEVIAKNLTALEPGDTLDFICNYYNYDGTLNDKYFLGDQMTVQHDMAEMTISNLVIEDKAIQVSFVLTDIYGQAHYTAPVQQ